MPTITRSQTRRPLIVAHRGASADAPENTLPAFELAWTQGADAIEGDFHLTRDREIVCIHDPNTRKRAGVKHTIRKTRLETLRQLDVGPWKGERWIGTRIPTLGEVIATIPAGKKLYIEIKSSPKILRHLYKVLDDAQLDSDQLVIISFSSRIIKRFKQERSGIKAFLLADFNHYSDSLGLQPNATQLLAKLRKSGADGLGVAAHPRFDQAFADAIIDAHYELHVWTVDDPSEARRWTELGVSSITTNVPALLKP